MTTTFREQLELRAGRGARLGARARGLPPGMLVGSGLLVVFLIVSVTAPWWAPHGVAETVDTPPAETGNGKVDPASVRPLLAEAAAASIEDIRVDDQLCDLKPFLTEILRPSDGSCPPRPVAELPGSTQIELVRDLVALWRAPLEVISD